MRTEGDAVLSVFFEGSTFGGAWLGVIEPELQPAHLQPVADQHPKRRMHQFISQSLEDFVPSVRSVIVRQFLKRVALRRFQKSPKLVFRDEMLGVRDVALFE